MMLACTQGLSTRAVFAPVVIAMGKWLKYKEFKRLQWPSPTFYWP